MAIYFNDGTKVRNASQIHMGIGGQPKKIQSIYYGIGGKGKLIYSGKDTNFGVINADVWNINNIYVKQTSLSGASIKDPTSVFPVNLLSGASTTQKNIGTTAKKIKLIDNSTHNTNGFFYISPYNQELNLKICICNELTNLNYFCRFRNIVDGLNSLNVDNGKDFSYSFALIRVAKQQKLKINLKPTAILNSTFYKINADLLSIFLNGNFEQTAVQLKTPFQEIYNLNDITIIGNYNKTASSLVFSCYNNICKINYINTNIKINTSTGLFMHINNCYIAANVTVTSVNLDNTFNNFKGGGYIYLNFPDSGYNVTNFMVDRNLPLDNLYIWVKYQVKINRIKTNILFNRSTSSAYTFTSVTDINMPDNPSIKYDGYYNEAAKVYLLYEI